MGVDLGTISPLDKPRTQFYLGDDASGFEPAAWRMRGRDTEDAFEGDLFNQSTRATGVSLAAASWRDLPSQALSRITGADGDLVLEAKTEDSSGDVVESEESDWFLPVTMMNLNNGLKWPRILTKFDFVGFGTPASDAIDITLNATSHTQLATFTVPKGFGVRGGWEVEVGGPTNNFIERFITLEDMIGFKPSDSVNRPVNDNDFTRLGYFEVKEGYEAFLGHRNLLTSHMYSLMQDDTGTAVEEPGWFRFWASDAEGQGHLPLFEAHQDQANISAQDIGQNLLVPPKPEIRVPTDSRINFGFKTEVAAGDTLESEECSLAWPITLVKL